MKQTFVFIFFAVAVSSAAYSCFKEQTLPVMNGCCLPLKNDKVTPLSGIWLKSVRLIKDRILLLILPALFMSEKVSFTSLKPGNNIFRAFNASGE